VSRPRAAAALLLLHAASPAAAEELIRVLVKADPVTVEELRLEDYVAGVVAGEMPGSFPAAALEAQAVAARSYALTRKLEAQAANRRWDIATGVLAQVFAAGQASPAARAAVTATEGEVLVLGMEPVEAYFHAACGGRTEGGLAALGRDLPYLAPVACGRCERAPGSRWTVKVAAGELGKLAGLGGPATDARILARTATGRAERIQLACGKAKVALAATDLRQRLGYSRLPSLAFEVRGEGGAFVFEGRGRGHGAGLCQWGAAGLAREGKTYREILLHYYPGTDVVRLY
jgi:stage II sporulation protein D (peptidoglycan lytic transglycosylase)